MYKTIQYLFVLPVRNEEVILRRSVKTLLNYLEHTWQNHNWKIVIANNGSTDSTALISEGLVRENPERIGYFSTKEAGRGGALYKVASTYPHQYLFYTDIDLPFPLEHLPTFFEPLEQGRAHIAIARRSGERPLKRQFLSACVRTVHRVFFRTSFSDPQCGAKAFTMKASALFEECHERGYFFDTEILVRAQKKGMRVFEIPIPWIEQRFLERSSKIILGRDSIKGLLAMIRIAMRLRPIATALIIIAAIGLLFLLLTFL